jgi:hypothetical protein
MSKKQQTLTIELEDESPVILTIERATARMGVARFQMMLAGDEANKTETDEALKPLRLITYPDCITATVKAEGIPWPLSFADFADLPEQVVNQWIEAVYQVNPQWRAVLDESAEKKDAT